MDKTETMKDGTSVRLRTLRPDDAERFYWFLGGLSREDQKYLRVDIRDRDRVIERLRAVDQDRVVRFIAEADAKIVAEGVLETPDPDVWDADVGEIRLLVAPRHRRKGLGMLLAREIYVLAVEKRLRKITARMMRPQKGARRIFRRLGFAEEATLKDHVKDADGQTQDLLVMSVDLEDMQQELRHFFESSDWRRHR
ncbi:MAG: GNAT family N-acetyltransferase [Planctomycetota bacterium]|jgi:RimJ/RimL family protein N-acetyltransferase